jgi:lycopene cyclase domain-containing protein
VTHWLYLVALVIAIGCLLLIDSRFKLAFWHDVKKTLLVTLAAVLIFIFWDILGIGLGIFFDGASVYMLPIRIIAHFPIEELFFLFLLSYTTLLIYLGVSKRWPRT